MRKVIREPIVQFALIGVAFFVYFKVVAPEASGVAAGSAPEVVIDTTVAAQLVDRFEQVWNRPPTVAELQGLVEGTLREEILVREALALGLDRGDAVIRNRLVQKMDFLTASAAQALEPEAAVLQAHLEANAGRFALQPAAGFVQVFLGEAPTEAEAQAALAQLRAGAAPETVGARSLLPAALPPATRQQVDGSFGAGFFDALAAAPLDEWSGPYASGFGQHLVRVTARSEGGLPALEAVRDKVLADWRQTQAETLGQAQYEAAKTRYGVQLPSEEALRQVLTP